MEPAGPDTESPLLSIFLLIFYFASFLSLNAKPNLTSMTSFIILGLADMRKIRCLGYSRAKVVVTIQMIHLETSQFSSHYDRINLIH